MKNMKSQKVIVIVNETESNGIIGIDDNVISIDMGLTKQIIDFRDISVFDKKENNTISLVLKNNKTIDLIFKDYLLLYKLIDDYFNNKKDEENRTGKKCPECGNINDINSNECNNCGYVFKIKRQIDKNKIIVPILIILIIVGIISAVLIINNNKKHTNDNQKLEQNSVQTSNIEKRIVDLMQKYSDGFEMYTYNMNNILSERGDFDWIKDYKKNIESLVFYDPWYEYDYDNDKLIEPKIIYCLIIKAKTEDTNIEANLHEFKKDHYYDKKLSVGILTDNGVVNPEFSDTYVNASKNGTVGVVGTYYYYISTTDQNFTNDMVNLLRDLD